MVINQKLIDSIDVEKQKQSHERKLVEDQERIRQDKIYKASKKKYIESSLDQIPLALELCSEDNSFDPNNLSACLKHILKLQTEKRNLANEYER